MQQTNVRRLAIALAAAAVAALTTTVVVLLRPAEQPQLPPAAAPSEEPQPGLTATAVKIDNVAAARPQTGLAAADVVYVEPVEGGLTRLLAVYTGRLPAVVGPVRSARVSDIQLLAQFGRPVLAYSGAANRVLPQLRAAELVNASPAERPAAYYRDPGRRAPHNLYLHPNRLPAPQRPPATPAVEFGAAPAGGTATTAHHVAYPASSFDFTWSATAKRWLITADGAPMTSTDAGRLAAATVVEQRVDVVYDQSGRDAAGHRSPIVRSVGEGPATVLRDGRRFAARWHRAAAAEPTRFETTDGEPLPLSAGPVWVLLVPNR